MKISRTSSDVKFSERDEIIDSDSNESGNADELKYVRAFFDDEVTELVCRQTNCIHTYICVVI